jgi:hypothetical protein
MSEIRLIDIVYDDCTEPIHCEKISETIYRCLESCIFIDSINYGCEIEVQEKNGKFMFLRKSKESPYQKFFYVWSQEILESKNGEKLKEEIIKIGGHWESAMGGIFIIHLFKGQEIELSRLLQLLNNDD